jgi:predicted enzyme related to lactoylglutathione lyase
MTLPPVTPTPTGTYHVGKIVWYDLLTEDVTAVKQFYGELFGWEFVDDSAGVYTTIVHGGTPIGGIVSIDEAENVSASRWLSALSVADVQEAVSQVESSGGEVLSGPRDVPDRGVMALVEDPQGAMVVLIRASGGDPADGELVTNRWMWTELWTRDPAAASSFYRSLVSYEQRTFEVADDSDYLVFIGESLPRAGVIKLSWEEVIPNWVPYVRVESAFAIAERAESLGGKLIIPPDPSVRAGSAALIADPSGAVFAVQVWPIPEQE